MGGKEKKAAGVVIKNLPKEGTKKERKKE